MKKTVLTFGLISGVFSSLMMLGTVPFMEKIGFDRGLIIGYTMITASFLLVFFGIRSYRENVGDGKISFGRAFSVGILITLISCAFYVGTWEVINYTIMPDFADKYAARMIEEMKASGAGQETINAKQQEMREFKKMYANPFYNVAMTFIEPFPIGLLITLVSSLILRRRQPSSQIPAVETA